MVKMLNRVVLLKHGTGIRDESSSISGVFLQSNDLMSQDAISLDLFHPTSLGSLCFGFPVGYDVA